jgi:hypothetical protein
VPPTFAQKVKTVNRKIMRPVGNFLKTTNRKVLRPVENFIRALRGKPKKVAHTHVQALPIAPTPPPMPQESNADRQIRELSELVCQLSKENVELREELQNQSSSNVIRKRVA